MGYGVTCIGLAATYCSIYVLGGVWKGGYYYCDYVLVSKTVWFNDVAAKIQPRGILKALQI